MKEQFRNIAFRDESLQRIQQMVAIVDEYSQQGLRLTARQLYYQFVSRNYIANTPRSYKNLTGLLADARYAGMVDWDAIEDRGREPTVWAQYDNIRAMVEREIKSFRLPRWDGQPYYVELWVEKQALAGVLEPIAAEYHATLMVNKGYSSASAMYASAQRFNEKLVGGQEPVLFYLGDHDPSGEDMVRDIRERLIEFGVSDITVRKLALNMPQIKQFNPPPNPAKLTDSRASGYIAKHGSSSWEVDALPPNELAKLIRRAFASVIDKAALDKVKAEEQRQREELENAMEGLDL